MNRRLPLLTAAVMAAITTAAMADATPKGAGDWPEWGGAPDKNMMAEIKKVPIKFAPGEFDPNSIEDRIDPATTKNIRWIAALGSQSYGTPTIADGRVYVGTNNDSPRNPKFKGDRSNVYCFDEKTGELLWELSIPKLGAGKVSDWEYLGICSSVTVVGDVAYVVTNRCELAALDVHGLKNGNQGFKNEGAYLAGPSGPGQPPKEPMKLDPTDADILWLFDMREELGVFPHNVTSSSPLVVDDQIWVTTSNGVDWSHKNVPQPNAPALVVLDRYTGELLAEEASGINQPDRLLHANWSSPALLTVDGKKQVVFGGGDGWVYGFDTEFTKDADGFPILKELWRFDANPPHYRVKDGEPVRYMTTNGPSELIATPIVWQNKIYVAIGQDPEHGEGAGNVVCYRIDKDAKGDITKTHRVWNDDTVDRTISTMAVYNGLAFMADYAGELHCFDANTGKKNWTYQTGAHIWASPLAAGGVVMIPNEDGVLSILKVDTKKQVVEKAEFPASIYCSPVVANGTLYIASQTHLYAIAEGATWKPTKPAKPAKPAKSDEADKQAAAE